NGYTRHSHWQRHDTLSKAAGICWWRRSLDFEVFEAIQNFFNRYAHLCLGQKRTDTAMVANAKADMLVRFAIRHDHFWTSEFFRLVIERSTYNQNGPSGLRVASA